MRRRLLYNEHGTITISEIYIASIYGMNENLFDNETYLGCKKIQFFLKYNKKIIYTSPFFTKVSLITLNEPIIFNKQPYSNNKYLYITIHIYHDDNTYTPYTDSHILIEKYQSSDNCRLIIFSQGQCNLQVIPTNLSIDTINVDYIGLNGVPNKITTSIGWNYTNKDTLWSYPNPPLIVLPNQEIMIYFERENEINELSVITPMMNGTYVLFINETNPYFKYSIHF